MVRNGVVVSGTGIGAVVGVPSALLGAGYIAHGTATAYHAQKNLAIGLRLAFSDTNNGNSNSDGVENSNSESNSSTGSEGGQHPEEKSNTAENLPDVNKAVNTNMPHAVERGVERGVFNDKKEASEILKSLSDDISKNGWPKGSIKDPSYSDRVLVPIGKGGLAAYKIDKKGKAVLKTILNERK